MCACFMPISHLGLIFEVEHLSVPENIVKTDIGVFFRIDGVSVLTKALHSSHDR